MSGQKQISSVLAVIFLGLLNFANSKHLRHTVEENVRDLQDDVVVKCHSAFPFCSVNDDINLDLLFLKYPGIPSNIGVSNNNILCPYLRMMARYGVVPDDGDAIYTLSETITGSKAMGMSRGLTLSLARAVSGIQKSKGIVTSNTLVNYEMLHDVGELSHGCGLTFGDGETAVSNAVRLKALRNFQRVKDVDGRISWENFKMVKEAQCVQGYNMTQSEKQTIGLTWSFLGGDKRGFVDFVDVNRFLNGMFPKTVGEPIPVDYDDRTLNFGEQIEGLDLSISIGGDSLETFAQDNIPNITIPDVDVDIDEVAFVVQEVSNSNNITLSDMNQLPDVNGMSDNIPDISGIIGDESEDNQFAGETSSLTNSQTTTTETSEGDLADIVENLPDISAVGDSLGLVFGSIRPASAGTSSP